MNAGGAQRRRLDRYELLAEIASGGMGIVLLARLGGVGGFQRLFAIKVMHPHLIESPHFVAMLLDEARVAAKIHHPNVVATVDVRAHANFYYIVMDYVDGFPLTRILDDVSFEPKNRIRVINRMLLDTMTGLDAAHNLRGDDGLPLGIVHRDVSPQNILIGVDGIGRLTDFGIALAATRITASRPGMIKGKPSYLAPEQARAQPVDRRADLWPLGVVLWEACTGRRLFAAENEAATVLQVVHEPIPLPSTHWPGVPPELEAVCMRALERDPERRFKTAREMALALERAAEASDLLADTHEVADLVRERFAAELELRRRSIQTYIAAIGEETEAVWVNDLYALPKLGDDAPAVSAAAAPNVSAKPDAPPALSPTSLPVSSGRGSAVPNTTTSAGTTAEPAPVKPPRRLGAVLIAAAVAAALVVLWVAQSREGDAPPVAGSELTDAPAREIEPAALAPAPAVAPASPTASSVNVQTAPDGTGPAPGVAAGQQRAPSGNAPAALSASNAARGVRAAPGRAGQPPKGAASSKPGEPRPAAAVPAPNDTGLPIEQNPYRFR